MIAVGVAEVTGKTEVGVRMGLFGRYGRVRIVGPSMSPALCHGDVVLAEFGAAVRAGAVVLVRWPDRPGQLSVKRAVRAVGRWWSVRGDNPFAPADAYQREPAHAVAVVRVRLWPRPGLVHPKR
jgi:phage repressor protein C with HTH and peptisase S24 domain